MTTPRTAEPRPITGWHVLAAMVGFFGVVIAVNVTMAVLASGSWTGLVVANSYVASQHFNEGLRAAEHQRALGWASHFAYRNGRVTLTIRDRDGNPVTGGVLSAGFGRPADDRDDMRLDLAEIAGGVYAANAELKPGVWAARFEGEAAGEPYRRDLRFHLDAGGTVQEQ